MNETDKEFINSLIHSDEFLQHYGVKGMKWGHHLKRQEPIEVSAARKVVKETKKEVKKAYSEERKSSWYGIRQPSTKAVKQRVAAEREHRYAKEDLGSIKILKRLNSKEKTKAQLDREEVYKKKGMSDDEAAVAAYKYLRTKKILITVGAVAATAAVGYAAYKIHDDRVDKILKSGTLLKNISDDSTSSIRDAFYSTNNEWDSVKYKGLYANSIKGRGKVPVQKEIKVLSDIRQASTNKAHLTFKEMMKTDQEFAKGVNDLMNKPAYWGNTYGRKTIRARKSLAKGVIDRNVYEVFNANLVNHAPEMQTLTDKFYGKLSSKGYNAIKDINDSKYSGYGTINPIIAFNTSGKVNVVSVKELADKEINGAFGKALLQITPPALIKSGATYAGPYLAIKGATKVLTEKNNSYAIQKYRKENPGTKMTNTEIIRILERGNKK